MMSKQPVIRLQGIGYVHAKPAGDLEPGDVTLWNYGNPATVESVVRKGRYVTVMLRDGYTHIAPRRMLDTRLVGVR